MHPYNKPIETPRKGLKKYNCRVPEYVGSSFRKRRQEEKADEEDEKGGV